MQCITKRESDTVLKHQTLFLYLPYIPLRVLLFRLSILRGWIEKMFVFAGHDWLLETQNINASVKEIHEHNSTLKEIACILFINL